MDLQSDFGAQASAQFDSWFTKGDGAEFKSAPLRNLLTRPLLEKKLPRSTMNVVASRRGAVFGSDVAL